MHERTNERKEDGRNLSARRRGKKNKREYHPEQIKTGCRHRRDLDGQVYFVSVCNTGVRSAQEFFEGRKKRARARVFGSVVSTAVPADEQRNSTLGTL